MRFPFELAAPAERVVKYVLGVLMHTKYGAPMFVARLLAALKMPLTHLGVLDDTLAQAWMRHSIEQMHALAPHYGDQARLIALAKAGRHTHMQISQMTGVARDTIRKHAGPSPRKGRGLK